MSACTTRENNGASDAIPTRFELSELFRLGDELAGDTVLFGAIGDRVSVDGSGRIFIGEQQNPQIYVFTAEGDLIKTIGQEGSAPSEFQRLESIKRTRVRDYWLCCGSLYEYANPKNGKSGSMAPYQSNQVFQKI
jgi:hypothetical protein